MNLRAPIVGIMLLVGVLGLAWWVGRSPVREEPRSPAASAAIAPAAITPDGGGPQPRSGPSPAWGPSPFGNGPVGVAPAPEAKTAAPNRFVSQIVRFEKLRARAVLQAGRRAELAQLARAMQAELPNQVSAGIVSAAEALLLTGALLEILEPDAQLRAAEMAQFSVQFLPPVDDETS